VFFCCLVGFVVLVVTFFGLGSLVRLFTGYSYKPLMTTSCEDILFFNSVPLCCLTIALYSQSQSLPSPSNPEEINILLFVLYLLSLTWNSHPQRTILLLYKNRFALCRFLIVGAVI